MEVTRENFSELKGAIVRGISECDFVAIDWELTGLHLASDRSGSYESLEDSFQRHKRSVQNFAPTQFGLGLFKQNRSTLKYEVEVYNIFVFPRPYKTFDPYFTVQSSSIEFLEKYKFDFQKWISKGLGYLPKDDEARIRKEIDSRFNPQGQAESSYNSKMTVGPDEATFLTGPAGDIEAWLAKGADAPSEFVLSPCNPYYRRLIYQEIAPKYPSLLAQAFETENREATIKFTRFDSKEAKEAALAHQHRDKIAELEEAVGFRFVVDALVESKKPMVGHNCLLDFFHLYSRFVGFLGNSHVDFKQNFHKAFPRVFDTKCIVHSNENIRKELEVVHLGAVHARVKAAPFTEIPHDLSDEYARYKSGDTYHEAGYDAYATGIVFGSLLTFLSQEKDITKILASPALNEIANKINIHAMLDSYVHFDGEDKTPSVENVLFIGPFEKATTTKDLNDHFRKAGIKFRIKWRNDFSAFLEFEPGTLTQELSDRLIAESQGSPFPLSTFAAFAATSASSSTSNARTPSHHASAPARHNPSPFKAPEAPTTTSTAAVSDPMEVDQVNGEEVHKGRKRVASVTEPLEDARADKKAKKE